MADVLGDNHAMVDRMAKAGLLASPAIEAAFRAVPRAWFLPHAAPEEVLDEHRAVPTHRGPHGEPTSSSSSPAIMALMLAALDVAPGHRVLEIGVGTGYDAALLAHLAGEPTLVTSVDIDPVVVDEARAHLAVAGQSEVDVRLGDGWQGASDRAPFDRVIVTAATADLAPAWVEQVRDPGVIVAPLWLADDFEVAAGFRRAGDRLHAVDVVPCAFMALQGEAPDLSPTSRASARAAKWWLRGNAHRRLSITATPTGRNRPRSRFGDGIVLPRPSYTFVVAPSDEA